MSNELFFKTNSKIEKILGRELISNNSIAIFELIKNSYDAGAKSVTIKFCDFDIPNNDNDIISNKKSYIEIVDDGKGMTFQEINDIWMELGTPDKNINKTQKVRVRKDHIDTVVNRIVNGEKGIGRLGVDKIGAILELESKSLKNNDLTNVTFNWNDFDDYSKQVNQIPCPYTVKKESNSSSGLSLTIKELRNNWSKKDIFKIKDNLKKFLSPVKNSNDDFKIVFEIQNLNSLGLDLSEVIVNDTFQYLENYIDAEISSDGLIKYKIKYLDKDEIDIKLKDEKPSFGPVKLKLFYLDKPQKSIFTKNMGLKPSQYGSVKIFKDNFQVQPYGEPKNDWIGIDEKHSQGVYRTFSTQNLVGHILISDKNNLEHLSSRIGLIEDTKEFKDMTIFIWKILEIFQDYIFEKLKNVAKSTSKYVFGEINNLENSTNNLVNDFNKIINDLPIGNDQKKELSDKLYSNSNNLNKHIKNIKNASDELDKKIKVYEQITSKEGFFLSIIHTIKNKIGFLKIDVSYLERLVIKNNLSFSMNNFKRTFNSVNYLTTTALDNINITDQKSITLDSTILLNNFKESIQSILHENSIALEMNNIERNIINVTNEGMLCIFDNLIDNSIKALKNIENPKITISCISDKNYVNFYFKDNGVGIPEKIKPFIFSLWTSENQYEKGSGMGLPTCKNIVESYSGDISLVENEYTLFRIRIPKEI